MKILKIVAILFICLSMLCCKSNTNDIENPDLNTNDTVEKDFDTLLKELVAAAENYPSDGISKNEREISSKVTNSKQFNLEKLINLLLHPTPKVRSLTAFTLLSQKIIPEKYYETIKKSFEMGNGWTPSLFRKIRNKESIEFLIESFKENPQIHGQIDNAIINLCEKAVPYLIKYFKESYENKEAVLRSTIFLFSKMKECAISAVPELVNISLNKKYDQETKISAINSIGEIGTINDEDLEKIKSLRKLKSEKINNAIDSLLFSIGSIEGITTLMDSIEKSKDCILLRDLAEKQERAKFTGTRLSEMLNSHRQIDDLVRVCIVRTIGYINYTPAVKTLIKIVKANENHWELVYVTIETLGKLRSKNSIPVLKDIAKNYWYEPVRKKATEAINKIENNIKEDKEESNHRNFAWDYFSFMDRDIKNLNIGKKCLDISGKEVLQDKNDTPKDFSVLKYKQEQVVYTRDPDGKAVKRTRIIDVVSSIGIKVNNGFIVGDDRGEFGGEVQFVGKNESYLIINDNAVEIRKTKKHGIIAATGLAHMVSNRGMLHKIIFDNKKWVAKPFFQLPGEPQFMKIMENGIYVNTRNGGSLLIDNDGHPIQCVEEK